MNLCKKNVIPTFSSSFFIFECNNNIFISFKSRLKTFLSGTVLKKIFGRLERLQMLVLMRIGPALIEFLEQPEHTTMFLSQTQYLHSNLSIMSISWIISDLDFMYLQKFLVRWIFGSFVMSKWKIFLQKTKSFNEATAIVVLASCWMLNKPFTSTVVFSLKTSFGQLAYYLCMNCGYSPIISFRLIDWIM